MTKQEAEAALEGHTKVQAGVGEDHDTGYIHFIRDDLQAVVGWDSGVKTPVFIADLTLV
jgi:hypothetical protein